jgi:pimeloyl-ACP methyl ester carboxylesterase
MTAEAIAPGEEVEDAYGAPSLLLRALEWRAGLEYGAMLASYPALRMAPHGDGHPVLVLPGFTAGDRTTRPLRAYLSELGYTTYGWGLGVNLGPTERVLEQLPERLADLGDNHGEPVSLIGWSLGGIFAREMARHSPDSVRQVLTLGSPFNLVHHRATHATRLYRAMARFHSPRLSSRMPNEFERGPLPVPATSIYSRTDGVVAWQSCLQEPDGRHENIEVWGSHVGLGVNPVVLFIIADRLAQSAGQWEPYRPMSTIARFLPPLRPYPG